MTPDYKNTLRLPQTDFPMKGNLAQKEPEIISSWTQQQIYHQMLEKNSGKKGFTLPDGPPYANASIHIGHALNKILKDLILKYKNMQGYYAPFYPGWDCHGLPIEHKVTKDLGSKAKEKSDQEIRELCRAEALKWVNHQEGQFQRLGIMADWKHRYLTMDKSYEAEEVREFARCVKAGVVYRGEKPVYWNWTLQTALADAEIEYHNHKSPSIYVKFFVTHEHTLKKFGLTAKDKLAFVIWTTTPWTLPANVAISLHPDFEYTLVKPNESNEHWVVAQALVDSFEKDIGLPLERLNFKIQGLELDRCEARHPFIDRTSLIILGDHVSLDAGTGCVHTAPGHGADDYRVGLKYDLPVLSPVDERGCFTNEVPDYVGINIFKANPIIVERLKTSQHLISHKEIEHSYPHCWRSKTPLIFRATPQWFIGLDLESNNIRTKALKAVAETHFFPPWGQARLKAMMENRPDWCLSRQRTWGVPIPIYYCLATGEPLIDTDVMMKLADRMEKENGIDSFYEIEPNDLLKSINKTTFSHANPKFGIEGFKRGRDILDVWFDSGICHAAVQKHRKGLTVPADIYLEGSDQHRGWFNTSLLSSIITNDIPPFKSLITHGFVNDSEGKKMSKSKGNTVDPNEVSSKNGAEIIRLWAVYEDYGQDLTCGPELLTRVTETYRRIRNTMRFLLGSQFDFDPKTELVAISELTPIDRWALHELNQLIKTVTEAYDNYEFYKVYHALNTFFTVTLSATYLDILKDRLYTWKHNGAHRKSSQTVLYYITDSLIRMMAPILSFLAEECYSYVKVTEEIKPVSVFLRSFPVSREEWQADQIKTEMDKILKVREEISKELELLRQQKIIGANLDATVTLTQEGDLYSVLTKYESQLKEIFIVSQVTLRKGAASIKTGKATGEKCVRCWNYDEKTNESAEFPGVCPKCVEALK